MAFNYKNPISSVQVNTPNSVLSTDTFGTNFSVLQVGGYMEVWNLDDLIYSAYGATGNISNSANTIPVSFYVRQAPTLSDRITLNSDGISSGRRRLGMMVYVQENGQTYQYNIDNYETLWDAANADGCIVASSTSCPILLAFSLAFIVSLLFLPFQLGGIGLVSGLFLNFSFFVAEILACCSSVSTIACAVLPL